MNGNNIPKQDQYLKILGLLDPENDDIGVLRNVGNCKPSDATSHPFQNHFVKLLYLKCLLLGAFAKLRKAIISFIMSVSPSVLSARNNSAPTKRIFMKFDI